jgi:drug/metabolite transporter (DMT)-like permease
MLAAVLTTLLFATSAVCGYRTARQLGGVTANFWRITLATLFLTLWAFTLGSGLAGAPGWFALSGLFGIGLGDSAYFQALPRLGSRRTVLLVQCLTAPFAALIEWLWLGSGLNRYEMAFAAVILAGVAIALAPGDHMHITAREWRIGIAAGTLAAVGGAMGAVIIRKGYAALAETGTQVDAGTTGCQRVLGGILIPAAMLLVIRLRRPLGGETAIVTAPRPTTAKTSPIWPWVLANALAGQTLGVTCMQWALKSTRAGVVAAIIATAPLVLLPMTRLVEGEKIGARSLLGASVAVAGVIGLTCCR